MRHGEGVADQNLIGTPWGEAELDLIVADHFAMLAAQLESRPFVKSHHRAALMQHVDRTNRSVEFKHMNISAVLTELGHPTIQGYKAKHHYQDALVDAVARYLTAHPQTLDLTTWVPIQDGFSEPPTLFETAPPSISSKAKPRSEPLERLVRKFDPVARDFRNRALGKAGEEAVFFAEQQRLRDADRADLARKVRWTAQEDGDGAGYDIASFDLSGSERLIEVKTTTGTDRTPFFLTRNEEALSRERPDAFKLYRLYDFRQAPRVFTLTPPLGEHVVLETETWRAGFG
jgi:hypothetical protein